MELKALEFFDVLQDLEAVTLREYAGVEQILFGYFPARLTHSFNLCFF